MWSVAYQLGDSNRGVVCLLIHGELQSHMCWSAVWEATDVTEDGVTASGYGAENASEIRAVRL